MNHLAACKNSSLAVPLFHFFKLHRHDNVIPRVLAADRLRWVMIIPDSVHLPSALVRAIVGIDRALAIASPSAV